MINIEYVDKLTPIFTKRKRIKLIVGSRGSTKSTAVGDYVLANVSNGELWCCAREHQNSIKESVHRSLLDEIDRLGFDGFEEKDGGLHHESGGRTFYKGLALNVTSLKSMLSGVDGLWIEEGEDLSDKTLKILSACVRLNAKDTEKLLSGRKVNSVEELDEILANSDIKLPEIIITMNRGSSTDPIVNHYLGRAEPELARCGYYEDDLLMVVEVNWNDIPRSWFIASGLEKERLDDLENRSEAFYNHKWGNGYNDSVENSIIDTKWFDAAIDAHKLERLKEAFKPHGAVICAHDPFNGGNDAGGFATRHGSIITCVKEKKDCDIDECFDWATAQAKIHGADMFVYDADGMGAGLKRQSALAFDGTRTNTKEFRGGLSGSAMDNADDYYLGDLVERKERKTYAETFKNNRARYYYELAQRFKNTYNCVIKGQYVDPDLMISLDSDGIENMQQLRSELCRIPEKLNNATGLFQLMSKQDMIKLGIKSPNLADSVMMTMISPVVKAKKKRKKLNYKNLGLV